MINNILLKFLFIILIPILLYSQVKIEHFLDNEPVTSIKQNGNEIWISTYGYGIYSYSPDEDEWENYSTKEGSGEGDLFYTFDISDRYIWGATSEGLFICDRRTGKWRKRKFGLGGDMGNWIRSLRYDEKENVLYIGRFQYLTVLDVKRQRYSDHDLTIGKDSKTNNIISIKLDGDSLVWFGTEAGVHIYNKKKDIKDNSAWSFINNKGRGFRSEGYAVSIRDMLFEGRNVWFGTDEFVTKERPEFNIGGIYIYDRGLNWDRISKVDGLPANGIYSLARTGNKIWAGVYEFNKIEKQEYGKGLVLIDRITGNVQPIDLNNTNINTSTITALHFDGKNLWIGTDKGVWRLEIFNPLAEWTLSKGRKRG